MAEGFWKRVIGEGELAKTAHIADRPHPITILFYWLTVLVSLSGVFAIYISLRALGMTEQNMKLGQKAYFAISDSRFSSHIKTEKSTVPGIGKSDHVLQLQYSFVLHNVGNTPGYIERNTDLQTALKCPPLDAGWKCHGMYHNTPAVVGPRSELRIDAGSDAVLNEAAFKLYAAGNRAAIEGKSRLVYRDEFNQISSIEWCWREDVKEKTTYSFKCAK
jgi:hypothetical protein